MVLYHKCRQTTYVHKDYKHTIRYEVRRDKKMASSDKQGDNILSLQTFCLSNRSLTLVVLQTVALSKQTQNIWDSST